MNKKQAIKNIKAIGENLYFEIKVLDEGTKLSKEEIKDIRNRLIDNKVEECITYMNILSIEEIRKYLITGLKSVMKQRHTEKDIEL